MVDARGWLGRALACVPACVWFWVRVLVRGAVACVPVPGDGGAHLYGDCDDGRDDEYGEAVRGGAGGDAARDGVVAGSGVFGVGDGLDGCVAPWACAVYDTVRFCSVLLSLRIGL